MCLLVGVAIIASSQFLLINYTFEPNFMNFLSPNQLKTISVLCFLSLLFSTNVFAQVGIGNTDPKSTLDVGGALSLREGPALSVGNGSNIDLGTTTYSQYRITGPTSDFDIKTFLTPSGASAANGQLLTLINTTTYNMTLVHNQGSNSNPQRRIYCPSGFNLVLEGQNSTVTLQYNTGLQRWVVVGYADLGGYGRNVYNNIGTTDINTNTASFTDMADMSISFTPKHAVVYVNFSASGTMDKGTNGDSQGYAEFQIQKDATPVAGTNTLTTDRSYIDTCREFFYDTGGAGSNYPDNDTQLVTFTPTNPTEKVSVRFDVFDTEEGYDGLMVYNGPTTASPIFSSGSTFNEPTCPNGAWTGTGAFSAQGVTFTSTATNGELTFQFTSDVNINSLGWEACVTSNYRIDTAWNAGFTMYPVSVTPGVPTTIKVLWRRDGNVPSVLRNNATDANRSHRNITILD